MAVTYAAWVDQGVCFRVYRTTVSLECFNMLLDKAICNSQTRYFESRKVAAESKHDLRCENGKY